MSRKQYNVIALVHIEGDTTITDMRVIDAYTLDTTDDALTVSDKLNEEAYEKYGKAKVTVYIQPFDRFAI